MGMTRLRSITAVLLCVGTVALLASCSVVETRSFGVWEDRSAGTGPMLCGGWLESYPPQCADPAGGIVGWDWDQIEHESGADVDGEPTVLWGDYVFTFDRVSPSKVRVDMEDVRL